MLKKCLKFLYFRINNLDFLLVILIFEAKMVKVPSMGDSITEGSVFEIAKSIFINSRGRIIC